MQSILYCVFMVAVTDSVNARRLTFNDYGMPIRVVDTSYGRGNRERINYIEAEIYPHHLTTNYRIIFPTSGRLETYYQASRAPGDERGHLVASQFSGPPEWYNLSPQNLRVNRNSEFQSISTEWYGTECEVRRYFEYGGNRYVKWRVRMAYVADSNRPHEYHLQVNFFENWRSTGEIDTHIRNPSLEEDSTFWICRHCPSNRYEHDQHNRRRIIEESCSRS